MNARFAMLAGVVACAAAAGAQTALPPLPPGGPVPIMVGLDAPWAPANYVPVQMVDTGRMAVMSGPRRAPEIEDIPGEEGMAAPARLQEPGKETYGSPSTPAPRRLEESADSMFTDEPAEDNGRGLRGDPMQAAGWLGEAVMQSERDDERSRQRRAAPDAAGQPENWFVREDEMTGKPPAEPGRFQFFRDDLSGGREPARRESGAWGVTGPDSPESRAAVP